MYHYNCISHLSGAAYSLRKYSTVKIITQAVSRQKKDILYLSPQARTWNIETELWSMWAAADALFLLRIIHDFFLNQLIPLIQFRTWIVSRNLYGGKFWVGVTFPIKLNICSIQSNSSVDWKLWKLFLSFLLFPLHWSTRWNDDKGSEQKLPQLYFLPAM